MGMAASQARLLTLTSRLHDIEYKAQNIESQKIALATQRDELYQTYCDALDAKTIKVKYRNGATFEYVDANFESLCKYSEYRDSNYCLKSAKNGKIYVDADTKTYYEKYSNDKYSFAWAMLGRDNNASEFNCQSIGINKNNFGENDVYMSDAEQQVYDAHKDEEILKVAWEKLEETLNDGESSDADKQKALDNFRAVLYKSPYAEEIYSYMRLNTNFGCTDPNSPEAMPEGSEDFPKDEFEYYVHIFEDIQNSGGCIEIEENFASGEDGNEWFNNMVQSGQVIIDVYNKTKKCWEETSVATSTNASNLQEFSDETDLKKAEAKYEYELSLINKKDTKFDKDLSKLETERTAITTEIEAIDKVKGENIDRTFGIFS